MLHLRYFPFELEFQYPFTTSKGTKTHQPTLVVGLGLGNLMGFGEAPAINYYGVTVEDMIASLEKNRTMIERYALTDPGRFWHFLHHLIPGQHFLTAALDMAAWDLFAQMRRMPLHQLLGIKQDKTVVTDYTIGISSIEEMKAKVAAHPMPTYKIKVGSQDGLAKLRELRQCTDAPFSIDANEAWNLEETKDMLPELQQLGVILIEQPLPRADENAMKELMALSPIPIPIFADESCRTEDEVKKCAGLFHGINIKLTKCGGITPALRMIKEARALGLQIMLGSMNESSIGTAAIAHLLPLVDFADADGPLLLKEDVATGLTYENGVITTGAVAGLGVRFLGKKMDKMG